MSGAICCFRFCFVTSAWPIFIIIVLCFVFDDTGKPNQRPNRWWILLLLLMMMMVPLLLHLASSVAIHVEWIIISSSSSSAPSSSSSNGNKYKYRRKVQDDGSVFFFHQLLFFWRRFESMRKIQSGCKSWYPNNNRMVIGNLLQNGITVPKMMTTTNGKTTVLASSWNGFKICFKHLCIF